MNKSLLLSLCTVSLLLIAVPVQAQSGCVNSPENPTAVLALAGAAGAAFSLARTRLGSRRSSK